ncbi:MAG: mechanosensitive ion channel family protein [Planctomycetota bacterium]
MPTPPPTLAQANPDPAEPATPVDESAAALPDDAPRSFADVGSELTNLISDVPSAVESMLPWLTLGLLKTIVVLLLAYAAYRLLNLVLNRLERRYRVDPSIVASLRTLLRWLAAGLTVAAVVQAWGVFELWTVVTTVVALVAIGFVAVWSVLSNMSCSVMLLTTRMFRVGDRVEILPENIAGKVAAINLLYTTLNTDDGDELSVPNNMFFQKIVKRSLTTKPPLPTETHHGQNI